MSDNDRGTDKATDVSDVAYARDMGPMAGRDEEQPNIAGSDESGYAAPVAPPVVAGAPSNYIEIDEGGDQSGRGADGDTEARQAQKAEQNL